LPLLPLHRALPAARRAARRAGALRGTGARAVGGRSRPDRALPSGGGRVVSERSPHPDSVAPAAEQPQSEAPRSEPPQSEAPRSEPPQSEAPRSERPQSEAPGQRWPSEWPTGRSPSEWPGDRTSEAPAWRPSELPPGADGPLLRAERVSKFFPVRTGIFGKTELLRALDGVSLYVRRGETLGLVGESGCGKSTLGRTLLRLIEPTYGRILFDGRDITELPDAELRALRRRMQIVF